MPLVETRDKEAIAAFCRGSAAIHAYELGDLDDFFWPHTRFYAWEVDGRPSQLALLYAEHDLPVLLALPEEPASDMTKLLDALLPALPARIYVHAGAGSFETLTARYAPATPPRARGPRGRGVPRVLRGGERGDRGARGRRRARRRGLDRASTPLLALRRHATAITLSVRAGVGTLRWHGAPTAEVLLTAARILELVRDDGEPFRRR